MKRASIIKFNTDNRYILYSISTLKQGGGISSEPNIKLEGPATNENLFKNLMTALNRSKVGVNENHSSESLKVFLKAFGLQKHEDLYNNSICISVVSRDGVISFFPTQNKGIDNGFDILLEAKIDISENKSPEEIVNALMDGLSRCK